MHQYPTQKASRQPKPISKGVTTPTLAHSKPSQQADEVSHETVETVTASLETIAIKIMRRKNPQNSESIQTINNICNSDETHIKITETEFGDPSDFEHSLTGMLINM